MRVSLTQCYPESLGIMELAGTGRATAEIARTLIDAPAVLWDADPPSAFSEADPPAPDE